jgi:hypothetical protein
LGIREKNYFNSVIIDTLFQDNISIRAIVIDANKIWYAANNSRFGFYDLDKRKKKEKFIQKIQRVQKYS